MVKSLILCEGKNDKSFLNDLIKHIGTLDNNIDIEVMQNKSNFFKLESYSTIKQKIDLGLYNKLLFVIDSDDNNNDVVYGGFENTKKELKAIIEELNIDDKSDFYIMCDPETQDGYLESLIFSTICPEKKECIEKFLDCSEFKSKDNHKAIIHQIYKLGYPETPYDFSHDCFGMLKSKICEMV